MRRWGSCGVVFGRLGTFVVHNIERLGWVCRFHQNVRWQWRVYSYRGNIHGPLMCEWHRSADHGGRCHCTRCKHSAYPASISFTAWLPHNTSAGDREIAYPPTLPAYLSAWPGRTVGHPHIVQGTTDWSRLKLHHHPFSILSALPWTTPTFHRTE